MTTTTSTRRLNGRDETNTTAGVHSSTDMDTQRSKKSFESRILYPSNIILEAQPNTNKNINFYNPPSISANFSLNEYEQKAKAQYKQSLIDFFETHQPSYIFEPLRKEYFWTNEPFNEDRITRIDRLLHNTSYFVQSSFWYLRILLAICVTIPIEIIHTILAGLIQPVLIRAPIIISDTLIKPFYSGLFNAIILPIGILLWNTTDLFAKIFQPFIHLFTLLFQPCIDCFQSIRSEKALTGQTREQQQLDNGDGYYRTEQKRSMLKV